MFCHQCGSKIEEGLAFCTNCGAKLIPENSASAANGNYQNAQAEPASSGQYVQPNQQGYAQPNPQFNQQGYAQPNPQFNQQGYVQPNPQFNQQGYAQPNSYANVSSDPDASPKHVSFGEAIKLFFVNYVNFEGRSTRSEYWWAELFTALLSIVSFIPIVGTALGGVISLGIMIPGISLTVRRLHDTGKSWPYIFMAFIPLAGPIILLVQLCQKSDGPNRWGMPAAD